MGKKVFFSVGFLKQEKPSQKKPAASSVILHGERQTNSRKENTA